MKRLEQIQAIDGMTDEYAHALVELGLDTYWEIYRLKASTLVSKVDDAVDSGLVGGSVDLDLAARWQKSAVRLSLTRIIDVTVQSSHFQTQLAGATVTAGDVAGTTDSEGTVRLWGVRPDVTRITAGCPGYLDIHSEVDLRPDRLHRLTFRLAPSRSGGRTPVYLSEYEGYLVEVGARDSLKTRNLALADLPEGALLRHVPPDDDGQVRLISMMRTRDGRTVYIDRTMVPTDQVPAGAQPDQLLEWSEGSLKISGYTRESLAAERFRRKFGLGEGVTPPRIIVDGIEPSELQGSVELPAVEREDLSPEQEAQLRKAFQDHPEGVPLSLLRTVLSGASGEGE